MKIFDKYIAGNRIPNKGFLWDYDCKNLDPNEYRGILIGRIIEIGKLEDFYAAFDVYGGIDNVREIARAEVTGLSDKGLNFMCHAFNLKKEDTQCYRKAQLRKEHLNS